MPVAVFKALAHLNQELMHDEVFLYREFHEIRLLGRPALAARDYMVTFYF